MKKINSIFVFLVLLALATGIFFLLNNRLKREVPTDTNNNPDSKVYYTSSSKLVSIDTIDDLVKYSDLVIIGTVLESEEIADGQLKYVVSVDKCFKGNAGSENIDVYESKDTLVCNKQYIFFLAMSDYPVYPREVYTSIDKDKLYEISNGKVNIYSFDSIREDSVENIIENIERSPYINQKTEHSNKKVIEYDSTENLIASSDHVVKVSINMVEKINKYVSLINVNVIEQYKGDLGKRNEFYVPTGLEAGNEYLLFLQESENGIVELTSRKGSIIGKDNLKDWNESIDILSDRK
jgi:hypothetical protein